MSTTRYKVIRVDGTIETHECKQTGLLQETQRAIGAETIDTINLHRGDLVMSVDDTGLIDGKPVNVKASRLYASVCRPAVQDQAVVCGDVAIVHDLDFGEFEDAPTPRPAALTCEEVVSSLGTLGLKCGQRATVIIANRDSLRYPMCPACADHNTRNRGGQDVGPVPADLLDLVDVWFNPDLMTRDTWTLSAPVDLSVEGLTGESTTPTPWAVLCKNDLCGRVFLTEAEYQRQMNAPDARWMCPRCCQDAEWDDDTYEQAMEASNADPR